eukprot:765469-Hanusia_phi.AAC.2
MPPSAALRKRLEQETSEQGRRQLEVWRRCWLTLRMKMIPAEARDDPQEQRERPRCQEDGRGSNSPHAR